MVLIVETKKTKPANQRLTGLILFSIY